MNEILVVRLHALHRLPRHDGRCRADRNSQKVQWRPSQTSLCETLFGFSIEEAKKAARRCFDNHCLAGGGVEREGGIGCGAGIGRHALVLVRVFRSFFTRSVAAGALLLQFAIFAVLLMCWNR